MWSAKQPGSRAPVVVKGVTGKASTPSATRRFKTSFAVVTRSFPYRRAYRPHPSSNPDQQPYTPLQPPLYRSVPPDRYYPIDWDYLSLIETKPHRIQGQVAAGYLPPT